MRVQNEKNGLKVRAIAGAHVVLLAMDMPEAKASGLLGFAVHRTDHDEDEAYWLAGFKTFAETDPGNGTGLLVTTDKHPIQDFLWGDYTAKPAHRYTYKVVAVYGKPKKLELRDAVEIDVVTESEEGETHCIWFNRGVADSQAYVRKFGERSPDAVPGRKAYQWLSRGLEEAMIAFIGRAVGPGYALRAAVYEFQHQPVLRAFAAALGRNADVRIVFDARENDSGPHERNVEAIREAGLDRPGVTIPRTRNPSYISHNKFIVLLKDGRPEAVWTGSTNITRGGIFGHSNVGHVVNDADVAGQYLDYWTQLANDPRSTDLKAWTDANPPVPDELPPKGCTALFSPRASEQALQWYAERFGAARESTFLTLAFTINKLFKQQLLTDRPYLRFVLLDNGRGGVEEVRRDYDNRISVGAHLAEGFLDRWAVESLSGFNTHVKYIHTKYMLIDPLGDDPIVVTGSANFSSASTVSNDENMLVIRGDTRVADIYLGEFMRLFSHFYFRSFVGRHKDASAHGEPTGGHLDPSDAWTKRFYSDDGPYAKQRKLFAG